MTRRGLFTALFGALVAPIVVGHAPATGTPIPLPPWGRDRIRADLIGYGKVRSFRLDEIARIYRVPPHEIGLISPGGAQP